MGGKGKARVCHMLLLPNQEGCLALVPLGNKATKTVLFIGTAHILERFLPQT